MLLSRRSAAFFGAAALTGALIGGKFWKFDERDFIYSCIRRVFSLYEIDEEAIDNFISDFMSIYSFHFVSGFDKLRFFLYYRIRDLGPVDSNLWPRLIYYEQFIVTIFIKSTDFSSLIGAGKISYTGIERFTVPGVCANKFSSYD